MKSNMLMTIILGLAIVLSSFTFLPPPDKYEVEITSSTVQWTGYHIAKSYSHTGKISIKTGTLEVQDGELISGTIVLDMNSIMNEDLTKEKDNKKLVNDLKSERFFNVNEHPEASLDIKKVNKTGEGKYSISADITIRGITEPIEFEATGSSQNGGSIKYKASLKVDRTKHEVMYGWSVGNVILGNTFDLEIELVAEKAVN